MASSSRKTREISAAARSRTLTESEYFDGLDFGTYPHNEIVRRFKSNNINTSKVTLESVRKFLVQSSNKEIRTRELETRMFDIVRNNMVISNKGFPERLNIVEYYKKSPQDKYRYTFYIRGWKLSAETIAKSCCTMSQSGEPSPHLQSVINTYNKPKDMSYEDVLRSEELTKKCYALWSQHLCSFRKPGSKNYSTEVQRARGIKSQKAQKEKQGYFYAEQVHRRDIKLTTRGYALLCWVDPGKNEVDIKINILYISTETATRTLEITQNDIDLVAQSEDLQR